MKAVILAGGRGTRIAEESEVRPKPMITIGGRPILWHIMKIYDAYGIRDFIICLGYKGYVIKEYFSNYLLHNAEVVELDLGERHTTISDYREERWKVTLVETGDATQTGGRLKRIAPWVRDEEAFCMTYGDGLADVDIGALIRHHKANGRLATLTAVSPPGRFGAVELEAGQVRRFVEKPKVDGQVINGGFFVLSPRVIDYIEDDGTVWEQAPLQTLAREDQLTAYQHSGFWQPMDTMRERDLLESLWLSGRAPWIGKGRD
jgi:glucose-1-phosphate cytidylyltransferase